MRENRLENALAYMAAGVIGFSILSIIVILASAWFKFSIPGAVIWLPMVGLPIGFLLVLTLLITSMVRKSRENR